METHTDKELYKKSKYDALKQIALKKQAIFNKSSQKRLVNPKNYENLLNLWV